MTNPHAAGIGARYFFNDIEITDVRDFGDDGSAKTADTTAGTDQDESHVVTQRSVQGNFTIVYQGTNAAGTAFYQIAYEGMQGTLKWGPLGTDAGLPKNQCEVTITGVSRPLAYGGEITRDYKWLRNGSWLAHDDLGDVWP